MRYILYTWWMLFGNSEGDKQPHKLSFLLKLLYILFLATLIMYICSLQKNHINNTLVYRVCENEFVRYYLFCSVCWEPPLPTVKPKKQIKRNAHVPLVNNVIYIRIILQTFQASISSKTNEKFDLVVASHTLIHICQVQ